MSGFGAELEPPEPVSSVGVVGYRSDGTKTSSVDYVASEEPLEIRVLHWVQDRLVTSRVAVTMRTPGHDFELAAGFLYSEGVLRGPKELEGISYCTDPAEPQRFNIVNVRLRRGVPFDEGSLSRNVFTSSACGVCGRAALEYVEKACPTRPVGDFAVKPETLFSLPSKLRGAQSVFSMTGGLHASALVDPDGKLLLVREDVGRHNAMDKLVGHLLLEGLLPAHNRIVVVSGRASFELVQKAVLAGIPMLVAVGAPSSLAVELAEQFGVTLVGFLRENRFNVYCAPHRIAQ